MVTMQLLNAYVAVLLWLVFCPTPAQPANLAQPALELSALDCSSPTRTRYTRLSEVCQGHVDHARKLGPASPVLVVQATKERVIQGYRCKRVQSNFFDLCAVWGHIKRYGPPQIEYTAPISPAQCHAIVSRGTFEREDGAQINIEPNTRKSYTLIKHGQLFLSTNDVACTGASVTLNRGEAVTGIIELLSVTITVQQIQIEVSPTHMMDLDDHLIIPSTCGDAAGCQAGHTAYIIPEKVSTCPLYSIRMLDMQPTTVTTHTGPQPAMVNLEHKMIFVTGRKEPSPSSCTQSFSMISTQYRQIRLIMNQADQAAVQTLAEGLPPSSLDLDLEIRSSEEFISYRFEKMFSDQIASTGHQLCTVAAHSLHQAEVSPFAKDSIIRIRGDVLQELQCHPVNVAARLGDKRGDGDQCTSALPVWHGTKPAWIQANGHVLMPDSEIDRVDCSAAYVPMFVTNVGSVLVADPTVRVIDINLEKLPNMLTANNTVMHLGFATDLIYTSQEVKKFNHLLHFSRSRHRLLDSMTQRVCEAPNACGGYQAPEGSSGFSLSQLEESVTHPFTSVFSSLRKMLDTVGGYCSLMIGLYCITTFSLRLYKLFKLLYHPHSTMTGRQALRLAFFPTHDYVRAIAAAHRTFQPPEMQEMHAMMGEGEINPLQD